MALSAATVWEVRTTGVDTNGGGFVTGATGTDYSQQDAAQYTATDLVVDATTNTKVTSTSHSFVAADVGNILQVTAGTGWTVGFYQIVSVASGAATLDRSPAAVSTTSGTYAVGGALASPGQASNAAAGAGNIVFIKYSATPFSITATTANTAGGPIDLTSYKSIELIGYDTTRTTLNLDTNRPTLQANAAITNIINIGFSGTDRLTWVRNLIVDGNSKAGCNGINCGIDQVTITDCKAINCLGSGISNSNNYVIRCEATACATGFTGMAYGCYSHGNTSHGFTSSSVIYCISYSNGGYGFQQGGFPYTAFNCIAVQNTGTGFGVVYDPRGGTLLINCIAYGNSLYGFGNALGGNLSLGTNAMFIRCASGGNTSGNSWSLAASAFTTSPLNNIVLTANPFTNSGSGDFSLNSTAGGGAACRAAGFPGVFPTGTTTGYLDIGAVQHQDSGGAAVTTGYGG